MKKFTFNLQRFVEIFNRNTSNTLISGTSENDSIFSCANYVF